MPTYPLAKSTASTISKRVLVLAALAAGHLAEANIAPASLFTDHAVLQQAQPIVVWGTADKGEAVKVELGTQSASAAADEQGHWKVSLPALPAGGPYTLTMSG